MLRPGDKAPDFVGRDHNGKTVKLSDFRQACRPVVLPEGRYAWLNRGGLRVPRPETGLRQEGSGHPRHLLRHPRRQQGVRRQVRLQLPAAGDTDRRSAPSCGANDPNKARSGVGVVIARTEPS